MDIKENLRLQESRTKAAAWKHWGPYLSERQWGTVREDYSESGDAWGYFTHDQARSRAYRWGEDGLAGISDDRQQLCFALALWNGADPILKERLFGMTNSEGNHGEDVKEYYYYLDSTPTHSYMKYLYKYPQAAFPYEDLVLTNKSRSRKEMEYELLDTGVFADDRYFDVFVEYAKAAPEDLLIKISIFNRGDQPAEIHVLPTLWFRNTWSWVSDMPRQRLKQVKGPGETTTIAANHPKLGDRYLYCQSGPDGKAVPLLFTENETNTERIFGTPNASPYVKDAFHNYLIHEQAAAVNQQGEGSKAAPHYRLVVKPGESQMIHLRLCETTPKGLKKAYAGSGGDPFGDFDEVMAERNDEADAFYDYITPDSLSPDQASVLRQALAGMLWSKQFYYYDVDRWLVERGADPLSPSRREAPRNSQWYHMVNADIISMPDKWEYPWYAAWDLAFHTIALLMVDPDFAKEQLELMLREGYLHPNGQIPAYEWNFGDVNPPVHAWATIFTYFTEVQLYGQGDLKFLEHAFHKLAINFTWWINRKDLTGKNVFQGGFLGLDNIGVFDRSAPLPTGGHLEQADGTAWMVFFSQMMLEIATELALQDSVYEDMMIKFYEHFLYIASAMDRIGVNEDEMWDEEDGFYYDLLRLPDGTSQRLKVRSIVGLLPLCAATVFSGEDLPKLPRFLERARWMRENRPGLLVNIHDTGTPGYDNRRLLSPLDESKLRRILARMLDETEFLSPYGIRALSRQHLEHPFILEIGGSEYRVGYLPAESDSGMFGGNSNWRGPIWMPMNILLVRALLQMYTYYGNDFQVECPTGSGNLMNLYQVAEEISNRLASIFLRDASGRRPVFGGSEKFQSDPHWRDHLLFFEYFHGDNGAGLGASNQTGWTGLVARLLQLFGGTNPEQFLQIGTRASLDIHD
jgi:Mannosylglycerate hydrolase MGH1-like glycoside hydrolase domain